jgi:hypothetical protein
MNLGGLRVLIALLGLAYWLNTGSRAMPGLVEMFRTDDVQARDGHSDVPIAQSRPRWTGFHSKVYIFG